MLDSKGQLRARLGMNGDTVSLSLHAAQGTLQLRLQTDDQGHSALQIQDAGGRFTKIDIRVDPLGCHVLLAGPTRQQSYLFLKDTGASGLVLTDAAGARRAQVMLSAEGSSEVSLWDAAGKPGAASASK